MEPAAYPAKNTEELNAVHTFLGLLDKERIKPDVKALDKVPNHDGSVELVDEKQRPVGELKVQIKKIPDGALQFDCPMDLVAYSQRVSSPFVLICVDVGNVKAYWIHISPVMAGIKPEQKTFTVKFQPTVDQIGEGFPYYGRWRELCTNYLERISKYPSLRQLVEEEIGLSQLAPADRALFQQYIDEVNLLLDVDLPIVKHEYFADAWKLGVSVHQTTPESLAYSIYTVPLGENAPIVTHVPRSGTAPRIVMQDGQEIGVLGFRMDGGPGAEVSTLWTSRAHFGDPVKSARTFVFHYLMNLLRDKRLHVHGLHQSVELLMWFTKQYAHTLGLPEADTYQTADLSYGLNVFLPAWYSLSRVRAMDYFQEHFREMLRHNPFPSFEQIANTVRRLGSPSEHEIREVIASPLRLPPLFVRTDSFFLPSLRQAVEFLLAANAEQITRPERPPTIHGTSALACYSAADLKHNVLAMLLGAAEDYPTFVKGNRFGRFESRLISGEVALVYAADPKEWPECRFGPKVDTYTVENPDRSLPLMTFVDLAQEPDSCRLADDTLILRGVSRPCTTSGWSSLLQFSQPRPTQAMLYDFLQHDLDQLFGERLSV
jgi:hypothetical protein